MEVRLWRGLLTVSGVEIGEWKEGHRHQGRVNCWCVCACACLHSCVCVCKWCVHVCVYTFGEGSGRKGGRGCQGVRRSESHVHTLTKP